MAMDITESPLIQHPSPKVRIHVHGLVHPLCITAIMMHNTACLETFMGCTYACTCIFFHGLAVHTVLYMYMYMYICLLLEQLFHEILLMLISLSRTRLSLKLIVQYQQLIQEMLEIRCVCI